MRTLALLTALAALNASPAAEARNFRQTYGATVASPAGCGGGCAWNVNSDYFVPRHCDSGQYDLFSPCKTSHSLSPACRNLHPIYAGYCMPFGSFHYKWRDHVYREHCGCTPLACTYGPWPWHMDKCHKHCRRTPALGANCEACGGGLPMASGCLQPYSGCIEANITVGGERFVFIGELPNVEPLGGEIIGVIQAFPADMAGTSQGGAGAAATMPGLAPGALPMRMPMRMQGEPLAPPAPAGNALTIPSVFGG